MIVASGNNKISLRASRTLKVIRKEFLCGHHAALLKSEEKLKQMPARPKS